MSDFTDQQGGAILELQGVCKSFGPTRALHQVDLDVRAGEVHALIGENGAGKSTLMKILSGAEQADAGVIALDGEVRRIDNPAAGLALGIAMIYQELMLAPDLTVEENLSLGQETHTLGFVRSPRDGMRRALTMLGHGDLPLGARVGNLSVGVQQVVEIARALLRNARIIIMDEPTSSLSGTDAQALFKVIRDLRETGISFVYISHFLEEVFEVADRYTVLRDGEAVGAGPMGETTIPEIIRMMVGRNLDDMFPQTPHEPGEPLLTVNNLSGDSLPRDVSFTLRRGEILGIAGLVGSGRSETVRSVFGLNAAQAGSIELAGDKLDARRIRPGRALRSGVDLLSEDRKGEGLATGMRVTENVTISSLPRFARWRGFGPLRLLFERERVQHWIGAINIRCQSPAQQVAELSGGNQQKVALARMLEQDADVILLDEPTRGIDVGSKVEIYRLIGQLAAQGKGVVFVSSYLPELLGVCDTIGVMHRGELRAVRPVAEWTEEAVMHVATSGNENSAA